MGGVLNWLTGANTDPNSVANNVGNYYSNAGTTSNNAYNNAGTNLQAAYAASVPQIGAQYANAAPAIQNAYDSSYGTAENNLINSTGSPAAAEFAQLQAQGLQPAFQQQQAALPGQLASMGLTGSGAGLNALGLLDSGQSSALASADAPLYANAESQYGNLLGAQASGTAGALSGNAEAGAGATANQIGAGTSAYGNLLGAQAGAQSNLAGAGAAGQAGAYTSTNSQNISDFYSTLSDAASAFGYNSAGQPPAAPATNYSSGATADNASLSGVYAPGSSANATNAQGQLTSDPYYGQAPTPNPTAAGNLPYNPYGTDQSAGEETQQAPNYNPYAAA